MKLTAVRHGETIENTKRVVQGQADGTLSDTGREQAAGLAEKLKEEQYDFIYSSDLKRCTDTAEAVRKYHADIPYETTEALREMNYGDLEGRIVKVDWKSYPGTFFTRKPGGAESIEDLAKRVTEFTDEVYARHVGASVLFVTHGGPIRVLRAAVNREDLKELYHQEMPNCGVFEFEITGELDYKKAVDR